MKALRSGGWLVVLTLVVGLAGGSGCRTSSPPVSDRSLLHIVVSIPPQAYFVERIGGDAVTVETMVPAGAEPHTYEPRPEQLKAISQADAYLSIRIDFEDAWMPRFTAANPDLRVVDTTQGIERLPLPPDISDQAGSNGATASREEQENLDPHIWLSPKLVKVQAQTIATTLSQLAPDQAAEFQANLATFEQDIEALDTRIRQTLQGVQTRQFLVFHPAWGYFARDYNLQMLAIEAGGQEPSAAELADLISLAQRHQIRVVFVSPQFSQRDAATIAKEISGQVLPIDPLAYDWLANLQRVADTFAEALHLPMPQPPAQGHRPQEQADHHPTAVAAATN